jgi:RNA polymerase sigma-70 factor (ECF subfamily)
MHSTPASLLQRLRRPGEAAAWARFVALYTPLLFGWARRLGLQEADAADLVQDVLALLFRKLPEFEYDPGRSFRGWLQVVLRNKWRERGRKPFPATAGGAALARVPDADGFAELEEAEYQRGLVRQALEALRGEFPALTWRVFHEYAVAGRPAEEVAAELGVRPGTVYAAKSRVLARLRRELAGLLD